MNGATRDDLTQKLRRLAEGERAAFAEVYAEAAPLLKRFSLRLLGDPAEAEDAAQQALLKIFSRASEFDGDRDALSWMLGVAAYECRSARKKRARRRETTAGETPLAGQAHPAADPAEALQLEQLLAAARQVLDALRPSDAAALELACEGAGVGAKQLGLSPPAFRKRVQRALDRARLLWRNRHGDQ